MDYSNPDLIQNEADVEQKLIYPLLTLVNFLSIPDSLVRPKDYLAPTQLDKASGKTSGYYPDFSIWIGGLPVMIVEAKDPSVNAQVGFREACLYARHLNSRYPTDINPCKFVMSSNGVNLLIGYWDQEAPVHTLEVARIDIETISLKHLTEFCHFDVLKSIAETSVAKLHPPKGTYPFNLAGGQALINSKFALNDFAADLSPILRRYFSSTSNIETDKEIAERAYVSSAELTEYDRVLEALLKDRSASAHKDSIVVPIKTSKSEEIPLTKALHTFSDSRQVSGQLQIIQGGVGSGKSLFARRYKDLLEPEDLKKTNCWAFIDFNGSPPSLKDAENWLCEAFIESFAHENPQIDLYSYEVLKGIFSRKIQQKRAVYELFRESSIEKEQEARATDLQSWQNDLPAFSEGIANYVNGGIQHRLIVVMDNVDKMELQNQLDAFQLSLWFMQKTNAFVILQMRDETYERYKNKPPLDTFRSGIAFHISPPRFIDVVKRRLDLAIEFLAENATERQEITLENGVRATFPKSELGDFLTALYKVIFGRRANVARLLEALSGRDVRKALEMFVSIVTSGHLSPNSILSNVKGEGSYPISEHTIIRILMRTDYRFFNDNNSNIANILHYNNDWKKPDNFLLSEILYFLCMNRRRQGELGLEGYFRVKRICSNLQKLGYEESDVHSAINYLLSKQLIVADNFNQNAVTLEECIKIQASGFFHLRLLCHRLEYLHGIIPVCPISNHTVAHKLSVFINSESQRQNPTLREKIQAVRLLCDFLKLEFNRLRENNPFYEQSESGAYYLISSIEDCLAGCTDRNHSKTTQDELDLL